MCMKMIQIHPHTCECHVNRKVEVGTIHPEAKKCQGQLANLQTFRVGKQILSPKEAILPYTLVSDFQPLPLQKKFRFLEPPVYGISFWLCCRLTSPSLNRLLLLLPF